MARDRGLPGDASTSALPQLRLLVQSQKAWAFSRRHCGLLGKLKCLIRKKKKKKQKVIGHGLKVEDRRFGWRRTNGMLGRMEGCYYVGLV